MKKHIIIMTALAAVSLALSFTIHSRLKRNPDLYPGSLLRQIFRVGPGNSIALEVTAKPEPASGDAYALISFIDNLGHTGQMKIKIETVTATNRNFGFMTIHPIQANQ